MRPYQEEASDAASFYSLKTGVKPGLIKDSCN